MSRPIFFFRRNSLVVLLSLAAATRGVIIPGEGESLADRGVGDFLEAEDQFDLELPAEKSPPGAAGADATMVSAPRGRDRTVLDFVSAAAGRPVMDATGSVRTVVSPSKPPREKRRRGTSRGVRGGRVASAEEPSSAASKKSSVLKISSLVTASVVDKLPSGMRFPVQSAE